MFPLPSTAMSLPVSSLLPPRSVENKRPEPDAFSFVINASVKKDDPVPAYKTDGSPGRTAMPRTNRLHRPAFAAAQLAPPLLDFVMPLLPIAAYTAEDVTSSALTEPCGTSFVSRVHEVAPLVLLLIPPEA